MNKSFEITMDLPEKVIKTFSNFFVSYWYAILIFILVTLSIFNFMNFYTNGLGLAYNDARSHLDIGRRVVEGLKPGLAQLGSVWLPLPHALMIPTVWNDFMWHSGLSGAIQSMVAYVVTGLLIYLFLKKLGVGVFPSIIATAVFATNANILYLQSTSMTELLLLATMTAGVYYLVLWHQHQKNIYIVLSSFWIMLSSLVRYEGWFLICYAAALVLIQIWKTKGHKAAEGMIIFFLTLAALGIFIWLLWNQLIFKDALYFALGPFSARTQQAQLKEAGVLATEGNLLLSLKTYLYALVYNTYALNTVLAGLGAVILFFDRRLKTGVRLACTALFAPLLFNILALYFGHSVVFIQGISGNTWFNVRYGAIMVPSVAIFIGYLLHRAKPVRVILIGLILLEMVVATISADAVTIDDARVGSSQKNVSEVSGWLRNHAKDEKGFVLISVASHDAIVFSSGLPMKKFIHEGTGGYWESATTSPDRWARWIVMRTHDDKDLVFKAVSRTPGFSKYNLVASYPFADIYEIRPEFITDLNTDPVLGKQK